MQDGEHHHEHSQSGYYPWFFEQGVVSGGGDSGNPEDDQAVNEYFPDLRNLPVDGQDSRRSGGASPSGQVEDPAPVNQRPKPTDSADDVEQDEDVETHTRRLRVEPPHLMMPVT